MRKSRLPAEIVRHYEAGAERGRLASGGGLLELLRTQEIIKRHLPRRKADILDVGGGPGVYSKWLAEMGHHVHLVDATPSHVRQARANARTESGELFAAELGDARHLGWPQHSFDVVLLFGPLYHLTKRKDRIRALREARRVLRPGGLLFAAAISRYASLVDGLKSKYVDDPVFQRILARDLKEGQHRNPHNNSKYFTTAFFHHPNELAHEVTESGFRLKEVYAVEGPGEILMHDDLERRLKRRDVRQRILGLIAAVETEPSLFGVSSHLLAVATR